VDTRVRDQVGLELGDVHVQSSIETQGSGQGRDDLCEESVEVGIGWALNVEVPSADVVDSFVVEDNCDVGVLKE